MQSEATLLQKGCFLTSFSTWQVIIPEHAWITRLINPEYYQPSTNTHRSLVILLLTNLLFFSEQYLLKGLTRVEINRFVRSLKTPDVWHELKNWDASATLATKSIMLLNIEELLDPWCLRLTRTRVISSSVLGNLRKEGKRIWEDFRRDRNSLHKSISCSSS